MRPLIVFSLISVLLLTFYIREGEAGPIHAVRSGVTTITSPVRFVGSAVAAPFNAIGNVFSNLTASQDTLDELKKQNEELTSKVAELSEAQKTAERLEGLVGLQSTYNLKSTAARIVGASGDAWTSTVTIDKGSARRPYHQHARDEFCRCYRPDYRGIGQNVDRAPDWRRELGRVRYGAGHARSGHAAGSG